jgi:acetolactate synthase small subunit
MEKPQQEFSELELKIGNMIRERYTETISTELSPEYKTILDEWMDTKIRFLIADTVSISKIDVRTHSVVLLFGKKFEKVKILINILEKYQVMENTEMFSELLYLI